MELGCDVWEKGLGASSVQETPATARGSDQSAMPHLAWGDGHGRHGFGGALHHPARGSNPAAAGASRAPVGSFVPGCQRAKRVHGAPPINLDPRKLALSCTAKVQSKSPISAVCW